MKENSEGETRTVGMRISFNGIANRIIRERGPVSRYEKWGLEEVLRLFNETRERYLAGEKEIADQFFDMIV
jgi:hypothetical protein